MKYLMFPHLTKIEEKIVKVYGIMAFQGINCEIIVKSITTHRKTIKHLVKSLNESKVELVHLNDILEDLQC